MTYPISIGDLPIASLILGSSGQIISANEVFSRLWDESPCMTDPPNIQDFLRYGNGQPVTLATFLAGGRNQSNIPEKCYLKRKSGEQILVDVLIKHHNEKFLLTLLPYLDGFDQKNALAKERCHRVGQYIHDIANSAFYFSPGAKAIYGLKIPDSEIGFESFFALHPKEERDRLKHLAIDAAKGKGHYATKTYFINESGKRIVLEVKASVSADSQGNILCVNALLKDMTQEQLLLEKLKLLVMYKNAIDVPVYFIDEHDQKVFPELSLFDDQPDGLFSYVNFSIAEYLELKEKALEHGQYKVKDISFDKFNTVYNISVTFEPQERVFIWVVENITQQFIQEQHQALSNRLTLLGNSFSNVSHDINNVLSIALGSIELLELKIESGDTQELMPYIERVKNAIDKGRNVTDRLLAFTRKPTIKIVEFDPNKEIADNRYLLEQLLANTIKLDVKLSNAPCVIRFPQGEFINILLNIVINAQDAIIDKGQSGTIEIVTSVNSRQRFEVQISDSGVGIQKENLTKVFDPFYSSKSKKKGNGIGLSNVYNTMYKHNGTIDVKGECELGGAQFTLSFKSASQNHALVAEGKQNFNHLIKGKHILVIDDEPSIVDFVDICLTEQGASVAKAINQNSLIHELKQMERLDVLLTDMYMPEFSCHEALAAVREKFPDIVILSMSGYVENEDKNWQHPVLRKPFNFNELKGFVGEQLYSSDT